VAFCRPDKRGKKRGVICDQTSGSTKESIPKGTPEDEKRKVVERREGKALFPIYGLKIRGVSCSPKFMGNKGTPMHSFGKK